MGRGGIEVVIFERKTGGSRAREEEASLEEGVNARAFQIAHSATLSRSHFEKRSIFRSWRRVEICWNPPGNESSTYGCSEADKETQCFWWIGFGKAAACTTRRKEASSSTRMGRLLGYDAQSIDVGGNVELARSCESGISVMI